MRSTINYGKSACDPHDLFDIQDNEIRLKYRTDLINVRQTNCLAYRIDSRVLLKQWKKQSHTKVSQLLDNFLGFLLGEDIESGTNSDVLLSLYIHGSLDFIYPSYQEYKQFWSGRPLRDFYLIVSTPDKDSVIPLLFKTFMDSRKLPIVDVLDVKAYPAGMRPMFRLHNRKLTCYIQQMTLDPDRGPQPCATFFAPDNGWLEPAFFPQDPEPCLTQDISAEVKVIRPSIPFFTLHHYGYFRGELKQYKFLEKKLADKSAAKKKGQAK